MKDYKQRKLNITLKTIQNLISEFSVKELLEVAFNDGWEACKYQPRDEIHHKSGNRYAMRNGKITGILSVFQQDAGPLLKDEITGYTWWMDGKFNLNGQESEFDLVSEYIEQKEADMDTDKLMGKNLSVYGDSEIKPLEIETFKTPRDINAYLLTNGNKVFKPDYGVVGFNEDGQLFNFTKDHGCFFSFHPVEDWKPYHEPKDWRDSVSPENPVFCWLDEAHAKAGKIINYLNGFYIGSYGLRHSYAEPVKPGEISFHKSEPPTDWRDLLNGDTVVVCQVSIDNRTWHPDFIVKFSNMLYVTINGAAFPYTKPILKNGDYVTYEIGAKQ